MERFPFLANDRRGKNTTLGAVIEGTRPIPDVALRRGGTGHD